MYKDKDERLNIYKKIESLEYDILELPKPNKVVLLHMSYEDGLKLKQNRLEKLDESESNENHLRLSELAYLELAKLYDFEIIECAKNGDIKTIEEIHEELYRIVVDGKQ